jgi:hypothetical protein
MAPPLYWEAETTNFGITYWFFCSCWGAAEKYQKGIIRYPCGILVHFQVIRENKRWAPVSFERNYHVQRLIAHRLDLVGVPRTLLGTLFYLIKPLFWDRI